MAARIARSVLLAGAAAFARAEAAAAWDDAVNLIQKSQFDANTTAGDVNVGGAGEGAALDMGLNFDEAASRKARAQKKEELLSMGSTGRWCLSDKHDGIGCLGPNKDCIKCVNGILACVAGYHPVIDYLGKMHCASSARKERCLKRGCTLGGCCEQTCCPPKLTEQGMKDRKTLFKALNASHLAKKSNATLTKPKFPSVSTVHSAVKTVGATPTKPIVPSVSTVHSAVKTAGATPTKPIVPSVSTAPSAVKTASATPTQPSVPSVSTVHSAAKTSSATPTKPSVPSLAVKTSQKHQTHQKHASQDGSSSAAHASPKTMKSHAGSHKRTVPSSSAAAHASSKTMKSHAGSHTKSATSSSAAAHASKKASAAVRMNAQTLSTADKVKAAAKKKHHSNSKHYLADHGITFWSVAPMARKVAGIPPRTGMELLPTGGCTENCNRKIMQEKRMPVNETELAEKEAHKMQVRATIAKKLAKKKALDELEDVREAVEKAATKEKVKEVMAQMKSSRNSQIALASKDSDSHVSKHSHTVF